MRKLTFPLSTAALGEWIPHRGSALWVDEVLSTNDDGGVCRVNLKKSANYADAEGKIRSSSFIEWIAQSYGFVSACGALADPEGTQKKPEKTFLVQAKDLDLFAPPLTVVEKDWLTIDVKKTHQLGPITLIEGKIFSSKSALLAQAKLKVYAGP